MRPALPFRTFAIAAALIAGAGCAVAGAAPAPSASPAAAAPAPYTAPIRGGDGAAMGTLTLREGPGGVLAVIEAEGLTPGWHGAHFHEKADCGDAKLTNSGAHINHAVAKTPHGLLNSGGPDFGDLPNIHAAADRTARAEVFSPLVTLGQAKPGRAALMDADGSALVIHAARDDHTTQPIGGAGARLACALIR